MTEKQWATPARRAACNERITSTPRAGQLPGLVGIVQVERAAVTLARRDARNAALRALEGRADGAGDVDIVAEIETVVDPQGSRSNQEFTHGEDTIRIDMVGRNGAADFTDLSRR